MNFATYRSLFHAASGMTMDYKDAKESFHAGNPGGTIWSINAVSAVALVSSITPLNQG